MICAVAPGSPGRDAPGRAKGKAAAVAAARGADFMSAALRSAPLAPQIRPPSGPGRGAKARRPIEDVLPAQGERGKAKGPRGRRRLLGVSRCAAQNFWPSGILRGKTLRRPCFAKLPLFFSLRLSFFVSWLAVASPFAAVASSGPGFLAVALSLLPLFFRPVSSFNFPFTFSFPCLPRFDPVFATCAALGSRGGSLAPSAPAERGKAAKLESARFDPPARKAKKKSGRNKRRGIIHRNNSRRRPADALGLGAMEKARRGGGRGRRERGAGKRGAPKSDGPWRRWRRGPCHPARRNKAGRAGRALAPRNRRRREGGGVGRRRGAGQESPSDAPAGLSLRAPLPSSRRRGLSASPQPSAQRGGEGGQAARHCSVAESNTKRYFTSPLIMRS